MWGKKFKNPYVSSLRLMFRLSVSWCGSFFLFSYTYQLRGVSSLFSATENAMKQLYFRSRYGRLLVCSPMVDIITICFKFCAEKEEKGVLFVVQFILFR